MWHVSSRSGVATLRTAIHLLLTYLLTYFLPPNQQRHGTEGRNFINRELWLQVRFLEAQNRKLADELEKLKAKWGKETSQIKAMYQAELDEARRLLDEAEKDKARLEIRVASLEEQLEETRTR